ncbi:potassium channel protein [Candidatus Bathyarchaeota archaeon]|nr:potassium channel protein [Candidatus Bathyarchaeota archaeon]
MDEFEKVRYKPIPIRELLTEMKDISELMIDLAYSAALFHSKELAEEVLELESYVDNLAYLLNMNAMLAARDAEDAEALLTVTTVANATDKISDAAADMAMLVLKGIGVHPLIRKAFQKVEEHLTRVKVEANSYFVDKTVGELKLAPAIGVDVIAIRRGRKWIIDPDEEEVIREGDILIARGAPAGIDEFEDVAEGKVEKLEEE